MDLMLVGIAHLFGGESILPIAFIAFVRSIPLLIFSGLFVGLLNDRPRFVAGLSADRQKTIAVLVILGVVTSLGYTLWRGIGILLLILLWQGHL
jgi:hypothetical protein